MSRPLFDVQLLMTDERILELIHEFLESRNLSQTAKLLETESLGPLEHTEGFELKPKEEPRMTELEELLLQAKVSSPNIRKPRVVRIASLRGSLDEATATNLIEESIHAEKESEDEHDRKHHVHIEENPVVLDTPDIKSPHLTQSLPQRSNLMYKSLRPSTSTDSIYQTNFKIDPAMLKSPVLSRHTRSKSLEHHSSIKRSEMPNPWGLRIDPENDFRNTPLSSPPPPPRDVTPRPKSLSKSHSPARGLSFSERTVEVILEPVVDEPTAEEVVVDQPSIHLSIPSPSLRLLSRSASASSIFKTGRSSSAGSLRSNKSRVSFVSGSDGEDDVKEEISSDDDDYEDDWSEDELGYYKEFLEGATPDDEDDDLDVSPPSEEEEPELSVADLSTTAIVPTSIPLSPIAEEKEVEERDITPLSQASGTTVTPPSEKYEVSESEDSGLFGEKEDEEKDVTRTPSGTLVNIFRFLSGGIGTKVTPLPEAGEDTQEEDSEENSFIQNGNYVYETFSLPVIRAKRTTGLEEAKDFPIIPNSIIASRYRIMDVLGSAAFSTAVRCEDLKTGKQICVKIIKNNKEFFDQSLDEIRLLQHINSHGDPDSNNVLRMHDFFYHKEHLFIVTELLDRNLYEFYKFNRETGDDNWFNLTRIRIIARQLLQSLNFIHSLGIMHCDLKPENILIKDYDRSSGFRGDCDLRTYSVQVKMIDFGSSCFTTDHMSSYVQSRSYRAPEVVLGLSYGQKIDIWSLGCILAELYTGKRDSPNQVLFQNESVVTLLARMVGVLGTFDEKLLKAARYRNRFFLRDGNLFEETKKGMWVIRPKSTSLSARLKCSDEGFVDFIGKLLTVKQEERPNAEEALRHPWLQTEAGQ
ncbi:Protein kinase domain containing protein [Planoprotostelium fungivorum]|uniref:Protein kinase domain containing protein n=1 Tax=Planoprotostelium fungivorum TaxID=1890364 RepID=A0A2P6NT95_9EUKA|nr:Protein kinase domain containing protein [Planoprotostelium fungivorum]